MNHNQDGSVGWAVVAGAAAGLFMLFKGSSNKPRKYAIDCEMVGGYRKSLLARVSIVDEDCKVVYDEIVRPTEEVYNYRTFIHGLTKDRIESGKSFYTVQNEVKNIISGKILIGHSVDVDLEVLNLSHPSSLIRDVATYQGFQHLNRGYKPSLKDLASGVLGISIQNGMHSSVEDATACMKLYKRVELNWH